MRKPGQRITKSVAELQKYICAEGMRISAELLCEFEQDPRKAVQAMGRQIRKRKNAEIKEDERLRTLLRYEVGLWKNGINYIAGVDEAGVGPLAGPVIAAAVILPRGFRLRGLNDSKKVTTESKREDLAAQIKAMAYCWSVGSAEVEEIDRLNIYQAGLVAMERAVAGLKVKPQYLLVDARTLPHCKIPQRGIIRGDSLSASIAAASIIAKTTRDRLMAEFDEQYPGYNFSAHKGYPTPEHCLALMRLGVLPVHRRSFARVREALGRQPLQRDLFEKA